MEKYKTRICDSLLTHKLEGVGAVLLEGPKWCGKGTPSEDNPRRRALVDAFK